MIKLIIYKITNKLNGKSYVGQTTRNVNARIAEHKYKKSLIGKAILKYGVNNFEIDILDECSSSDELNKREAHWTKTLNTVHPNGYNKAIVATRYGEHNGFFQKSHNQETIKSNQKNQPKRRRVRCIDTGEIYISVRECERFTGVPRTRIINLCKGKTKKTKGLMFEYVS